MDRLQQHVSQKADGVLKQSNHHHHQLAPNSATPPPLRSTSSVPRQADLPGATAFYLRTMLGRLSRKAIKIEWSRRRSCGPDGREGSLTLPVQEFRTF